MPEVPHAPSPGRSTRPSHVVQAGSSPTAIHAGRKLTRYEEVLRDLVAPDTLRSSDDPLDLRPVGAASIQALRRATALLRQALLALEAAYDDPQAASARRKPGPLPLPAPGSPDTRPTHAASGLDERVIRRIYARITYDRGHMIWHGATSGGSGTGKPVCRVDGKIRMVARVVWEHEHGPLPPAGRLRQRCDLHTCIAPAHHALYTQGTLQAARVQAPPGLPVAQARTPSPRPASLGDDEAITPAQIQEANGLCPYGHQRTRQRSGRLTCRVCDNLRKAGRSHERVLTRSSGELFGPTYTGDPYSPNTDPESALLLGVLSAVK